MSFVATKSGLTRTRIFDESPRVKKLAKLFIERHGRAVDEAWYSRTVDWNMRFSEDATIISVAYNAYIRLIAKLRQRITQRHPAVNDTRSNCDPSLVEEYAEPGSGQESASEQPPPADRMQEDAPDGAETGPTSSSAAAGVVDRTPDQQDQQQQPQNATSDETPPPPSFEPPKINYNEYSSFDFLDLLANSSVHVSAYQTVIVNRAKRQSRTPVGVTGHLYSTLR